MTPQEERLFEEHRDWAESLAQQYAEKHGSLNGLVMEDYRQHALLGLLKAVHSFDPGHGKAFQAHAWKRVWGEIGQGVRNADEVGRSRRSAGIRGPSVSLEDRAIGSDGERVILLRDLIRSTRHEDRCAAHDAIGMILSGLSCEARAVVYLVAVVELSQRQVARVLGLSSDKVSQIWNTSHEWLAEQRTVLRG
jgi:RNA polymerase sigma factor (sigma-70 family)